MDNSSVIRLFNRKTRISSIHMFSVNPSGQKITVELEVNNSIEGLHDLCHRIDDMSYSLWDTICQLGIEKPLPIEVVVYFDEEEYEEPIRFFVGEATIDYALWMEFDGEIIPLFKEVDDFSPAIRNIELLLEVGRRNPCYAKVFGYDKEKRICSVLIDTDTQNGICRMERNHLSK